MRLGLVVLCVGACGGSDGGPGGNPNGTSGPYFDKPMFFNEDVSGVSKAAYSDTAIASLRAAGGWGNGDTMQIDFSFDVLAADASTPHQTFTPTGDFYTPDCDHVEMPVPVGGNVSGSFQGGCLAVWDGKMAYGDTLRGDQCTSADAAGFPISPLLFTADEVAAGEIAHAIRFILPNDRPKKGYVRPATHGTNTTGGTDAPSYGVHLRLRADYPIDSLPSEGAKVVARAMQKYGMYHADGGNIALTGQSDRYTTAKWDGLLAPRDLADLQVEDFDVIDHGAPIALTLDCMR
jgi:hypothetical protein